MSTAADPSSRLPIRPTIGRGRPVAARLGAPPRVQDRGALRRGSRGCPTTGWRPGPGVGVAPDRATAAPSPTLDRWTRRSASGVPRSPSAKRALRASEDRQDPSLLGGGPGAAGPTARGLPMAWMRRTSRRPRPSEWHGPRPGRGARSGPRPTWTCELTAARTTCERLPARVVHGRSLQPCGELGPSTLDSGPASGPARSAATVLAEAAAGARAVSTARRTAARIACTARAVEGVDDAERAMSLQHRRTVPDRRTVLLDGIAGACARDRQRRAPFGVEPTGRRRRGPSISS